MRRLAFSSAFIIASVSAAAVCSLKPSGSDNSIVASTQPAPSAKAPALVQSAWYAGWHAQTTTGVNFPVSSISWDRYTHMTYAFAITTPDVHTLGITPQDEQVIPELVAAAHSNHVTVSISVGGWTGSQYFSTAVATPQSRTAFVKTLTNFVQKFKFDGIDFDWEYPNHQGVGCNTISSKDSANFLLLLQELRSTKSTSHLILSAATSLTPFADSSGSPSTDVSGFAKVLDFIEVMNYDVWGSWTATVGPNAPLDDSCASQADRQGSAVSAVSAWTAAGMPPHQIVLGVASYGHSFSVSPSNAVANGNLALYASFNAGNQPNGDPWDDAAGADQCGNQQPVGGIFNFWGLMKEGYLTQNGSSAHGIDYRFDTCSQTAFVYNPKNQVEISFDDARAFNAKGNFIRTKGLRGFSMWEAGGDSNDILLDAIIGGIGHSA